MKQALYLQYRPTRFAELTGQEPIVRTLRTAVKADRVAHAYLFTGPRGTGKTTTARVLAKGINCLKPKDGEPDNRCDICTAINAGASMDVIEVDAASNRGIDEIRELRDKVRVSPTKAKRKVYIIDEVHMLTKEAFNALLKTLEEPPAHAVFVLATTEPQKVPQTIISRCQRFDFRPATAPQIAEHVAGIAKEEGVKIEAEAAELIAAQARGSFRDSLSILDLLASLGEKSITADTVRDILGLANVAAVASLERALVKRDRAAAIGVIREATEQGISAETFRQALIDYLRKLMLAKVGAPAPKKAGVLAADWELADLTAAVRAYLEAGDLLQSSAVPELPLEVATLELLAEDSIAPPAPKTAATPETPIETLANAVAKESAKPAAATGKPAPASPKAKPPSDAAALWEKLLLATKGDYSLSVSLQKTRPVKLTKDSLELAVSSEFFLNKLVAPKVRQQLESLIETELGRKVRLNCDLVKPEDVDIFEGALQVFEGAQLE